MKGSEHTEREIKNLGSLTASKGCQGQWAQQLQELNGKKRMKKNPPRGKLVQRQRVRIQGRGTDRGRAHHKCLAVSRRAVRLDSVSGRTIWKLRLYNVNQ